MSASAAASKNARAAMLATLRKGLADAPFVVPAPPARPASVPIGPDAWERLAAVLEPLGVRLRLAGNRAEACEHVADIAREQQARTYTRWDTALDGLGLDEALSGLVRVAPGPCKDLGQVDLGLALAHGALVESGSMVLVAAPGRPRAASLLPPASVILVPKSALLPDVSHMPALLARYGEDGRAPSCLNLVTGPSSTADIELVLVRGVHGPGTLDVIALDWDD